MSGNEASLRVPGGMEGKDEIVSTLLYWSRELKEPAIC